MLPFFFFFGKCIVGRMGGIRFGDVAFWEGEQGGDSGGRRPLFFVIIPGDLDRQLP